MRVNRLFLNDVLFSLYAAEFQGWPELNRTNFQKILYFCATLAPLVEIDWRYGFINAPYGPFNAEIHKATDLLVPYGYVTITNLTLQKDSKLRALYRITQRGKGEVERIAALRKEKERLEWITLVMKVLDIYGLKVITKLAYKEPTFSQTRRQNQRAIDLSMQENLSTELLQILSSELERNYSITLDTLTSKLIVYFDFLSSDVGRGARE